MCARAALGSLSIPRQSVSSLRQEASFRGSVGAAGGAHERARGCTRRAAHAQLPPSTLAMRMQAARALHLPATLCLQHCARRRPWVYFRWEPNGVQCGVHCV